MIAMNKFMQWAELTHELQTDIHRTAREHGFWDKPRSLAHSIALIHGELSEALEADRRGKGDDMVGEELADAAIRLFDLADSMDVDLGWEIMEKHRYNQSRPRLHDKRY